MGGKSSREDKEVREDQLPIPVRQAKMISPRMREITEQIISLCQKDQYHLINNELQKISYKLPENSLPLCLEKRNEFYASRNGQGQIICRECFQNQKQKRQLQSYELIEREKGGFCGCGNQEMSESVQCAKHNAKEKLMENEEEVQLFKKQIKFLFNLAIFIRDTNTPDKVSPDNLQTLGKSLLDFVFSLTAKNNTIAKLTEEILIDRSQHLDLDNRENNLRSVFEEMVDYTPNNNVLNSLEAIMDCIIRTDREKTGMIEIMMKYLLSKDQISLRIVNLFRKIGLKPEVFPKSFENYFMDKKHCNMMMPELDTQNLENVLKKYTDLTKLYFQLFEQIRIGTIKTPITIFKNIFEQTKLEGLLNFEQYYLQNNEANNEINKMGLYYTIFLSKIIPKMVTTTDKLIVFKELLRESFCYIADRSTSTFNRVFERLFATLAFEIFQFRVPSKKQLEEVLGPLNYKTISSILLHYVHFKIIFEEEYKDIIINCDIQQTNQRENIAQMKIVALDQYYFKIFANTLNPQEVQLLYQGYIQQKLGELLSMNQYDDQNIKNYLLKLSQFLHVFATTLTSQMPELILSANLQQESKNSEIILSNLLHILENKEASDFKKEVQKFIENQDLIISFIKREALVENKKIKNKIPDIPYVICLTPDCEYLEEDMEFEHYERVVNRVKEKNQYFERYFSESSLKQFLQIYTKCTEVIIGPQFHHKQYQQQIILTVQTLCNLYSFNKSDHILNLIDKLSKKITVPSVRLQAQFKTIFQKDMVDQKEQAKTLSEKKRQKLEAIKMKQQKALSNFKVEEENKINLECIFCKNSREGQPYLLAHFRYNNFYSKKILQMDAPFMEFTTCGHSAHEQCLTEMHKGQFRIWYPCILCKSITNILLPFTPSDLKDEKKLQKFLDFLKNFAATYTFFFQSRKQLVQFGVNQIDGVYKLLFKTIIYSLTIYPIVNHSYFVQNQFPILKFIFNLLKYTHKKVKNLTFCADYDLKVDNQLSNIFHYHRYQLEFLVINNFSNMPLQRKIDEYRDQFSDELTDLFDEIYQNLSDEKDGFSCQLKDQNIRNHIKGSIYRPPQDLNQLRNFKKHCKSCEKQEEKSWICLLCEWSCCSKCTDVRKVHAVEEHIGETVFISSYTGQICYIHEELTGDFHSVYVDYLGHQVQNKKNIGVEEFNLNQTSWSKIVNDIVCNRLHKEVMRLKG